MASNLSTMTLGGGGSQSSLLSNFSTQSNLIASNISNINLNPVQQPQPQPQQQQQQQQPQQQQQVATESINMPSTEQVNSQPNPAQASNPTTFASTFASYTPSNLTHPPPPPPPTNVQAQQAMPHMSHQMPTTASLFQTIPSQQQQQQQRVDSFAPHTSSIPANISFTPLPLQQQQPNFLQQFKLETNMSNLNLGNAAAPAQLAPQQQHSPNDSAAKQQQFTEMNANTNTNQMVQSLVQQTISNHFNQQQLQQQQQQQQQQPLPFVPPKLFNPAGHSHDCSSHGHSHDHH